MAGSKSGNVHSLALFACKLCVNLRLSYLSASHVDDVIHPCCEVKGRPDQGGGKVRGRSKGEKGGNSEQCLYLIVFVV